MHWLVRSMLVDVGREIALIASVRELNLNVARVDLLQPTIIRGVIHRLKEVICYAVINSGKELAELLRAMVRIGAILIEVVLARGVGTIGNLASIIKDEDGHRDVHKLVVVHFDLE
jgi:hypothetical protein